MARSTHREVRGSSLARAVAKTFDAVWATSSANYVFLLAQKTFEFGDSPPAPAPLYILSMPFYTWRSLYKI